MAGEQERKLEASGHPTGARGALWCWRSLEWKQKNWEEKSGVFAKSKKWKSHDKKIYSGWCRSSVIWLYIIYIHMDLRDKNEVERRRQTGWFVCLFACTLFGSRLIQCTQSLYFVSLLRCQGSCVHTVMSRCWRKVVWQRLPGSTIHSPRPRALHPASFRMVRAWKCVVMGSLNSHRPGDLFSSFTLKSLTMQTKLWILPPPPPLVPPRLRMTWMMPDVLWWLRVFFIPPPSSEA